MSHFDIKLISKISHEVMSPIISSRWALEIILGDKNLNIDSDKRLFLENIYSNLNRISTVSNKLINYARYFANELLPVKLDTDVSILLKKIVDGLSRDFSEANIKLSIQDSNYIIPADQSMIEFIFHSLIHNAIVYSSSGFEIVVNLNKDDSGKIFLEIKDKGIGILVDDIPKVFMEFFRARNSDEVYAKGIGLSLFLCKKMCEACGYEISFFSEKGNGTIFNVFIPSPFSKNLKNE